MAELREEEEVEEAEDVHTCPSIKHVLHLGTVTSAQARAWGAGREASDTEKQKRKEEAAWWRRGVTTAHLRQDGAGGKAADALGAALLLLQAASSCRSSAAAAASWGGSARILVKYPAGSVLVMQKTVGQRGGAMTLSKGGSEKKGREIATV